LITMPYQHLVNPFREIKTVLSLIFLVKLVNRMRKENY
jgi:hypothetical protein